MTEAAFIPALDRADSKRRHVSIALPAVAGATNFTPNGVFYLAEWPQIRHVPKGQQGTTARVCALLSACPSAGFLVHRRLGLTMEEVLPILESLYSQGYLQCHAMRKQEEDIHEPMPAKSNIWEKLLKKLTG